MSNYEKLDELIISEIARGESPLWSTVVMREASRIAELTGRDTFRVTDGRLQALRRAGKIYYLTKSRALSGNCGWRVKERS